MFTCAMALQGKRRVGTSHVIKNLQVLPSLTVSTTPITLRLLCIVDECKVLETQSDPGPR